MISMTKFFELIVTNKTVKAWVGAFVAGASVYGTAVQDGVFTGAELGTLVGAMAVALGLVYRVPNGKASE
jgi:hypothetical protein